MIGLIFGDTELPKYILKKIKKKQKYLIIDLTKKRPLKKIKIHTLYQQDNLARLYHYSNLRIVKKSYLLEKSLNLILNQLN